MKVACCLCVATAFLAGDLFGQEQQPTLARWSGVGPGSFIQAKVINETGEGAKQESSVRNMLLKISRDGSFSILVHPVPRGDAKPATHNFVPGLNPEQAGMRLRSTKDDQCMIDGRDIPVTVKRYVVDNTSDDAMRIAYHSKDNSPKRKERLRLFQGELTFHEVKDDALLVPYREIESFGAAIGLNPRVVRVKMELTYSLEEGGVARRVAYEATARKLREARQVAGRPIVCTSFEERSERSLGTESVVTRSGTIWFSEEIPGKFVGHDHDIEALKKGVLETSKNIAQVESFSVEPEIHDVDPRKLPPLASRAKIPGGDWKGMHEGAWQLIFEQTIDVAAAKEIGRGIHVMQVVRMVEDGPVICDKNIGLGPTHWMGLQWFPLNPDPPKPPPVVKGKEASQVNGENVACQVQTQPASDGTFAGEQTQWIPIDAVWKRRLADARLDNIRSQTELKSPDGKSTIRMLDLVRRYDRTATVGRRELVCLETATEVTLNGKSQMRTDCLWSDQVPGSKVLVMKVQNNQARRMQILDFGEADQPIPDKAEINRLMEAAERTLKSMKTPGK